MNAKKQCCYWSKQEKFEYISSMRPVKWGHKKKMRFNSNVDLQWWFFYCLFLLQKLTILWCSGASKNPFYCLTNSVSWSRDGVVVIALASQLRSLDSGHKGVKLLVLYSAPRGFSPRSLVFPSPQNQHFQFTIPSDAGTPWKPLSGEWIFLGKYQ